MNTIDTVNFFTPFGIGIAVTAYGLDLNPFQASLTSLTYSFPALVCEGVPLALKKFDLITLDEEASISWKCAGAYLVAAQLLLGHTPKEILNWGSIFLLSRAVSSLVRPQFDLLPEPEVFDEPVAPPPSPPPEVEDDSSVPPDEPSSDGSEYGDPVGEPFVDSGAGASAPPLVPPPTQEQKESTPQTTDELLGELIRANRPNWLPELGELRYSSEKETPVLQAVIDALPNPNQAGYNEAKQWMATNVFPLFIGHENSLFKGLLREGRSRADLFAVPYQIPKFGAATLLHQYVIVGEFPLIESLVQNLPPADLEIQDENGETPLFVAVRFSRSDVVELFKNRNANFGHFSEKTGSLLHAAFSHMVDYDIIFALTGNRAVREHDAKRDCNGHTARDVASAFFQNQNGFLSIQTQAEYGAKEWSFEDLAKDCRWLLKNGRNALSRNFSRTARRPKQ